MRISTAIKEITVGDLWAVVSGSNTGTAFQMKDSSTLNIYDKYMMLLQKRQSGWKIRRIIWNSDINRNIETSKPPGSSYSPPDTVYTSK